jgi:hypothetical protein
MSNVFCTDIQRKFTVEVTPIYEYDHTEISAELKGEILIIKPIFTTKFEGIFKNNCMLLRTEESIIILHY